MKMPKMFYLGVALALAGIVLMSLPDKACEDCEDDAIDIVTEIVDEVTGD
jgi:hypothetical protein